jgi:hypothetical protein
MRPKGCKKKYKSVLSLYRNVHMQAGNKTKSSEENFDSGLKK